VAFSPRGGRFLSGNAGGHLHLWDVATGKQVHTWTTGKIRSAAFSPDGRRALFGSGILHQALMDLADVESGKQLSAFVHPDEVVAVAFFPDGAHALSAAKDGTVRVWGLPR
jgi:WD40 repeat protein